MATLPEMQPLVKGGHARMPDRLRSTLFRRQYPVYLTVPSFLRQPTPQSPRQIHQTMDGSFQNFYAFNYLLKGLGMHQTWITAVDLRKLFEKYGAYPHGNFLLLTMSTPDSEARWRKMYNSLSGYFEIPCLREQGPPFNRPLHYLVAALLEADKPERETSAIISAIGNFMSTVRMFHQRRLFGDQEVRGRGREW
ncbi:unnamed protein product [Penicillium camemberti]|uniref:Str. FM013 n=1 Tax=Penicillium camemberti (strain FM 013) TaxID=1429867 RepID=A0A0G4P897_PENC3|nr:unnamed protein product [Penicillium camemberti]